MAEWRVFYSKPHSSGPKCFDVWTDFCGAAAPRGEEHREDTYIAVSAEYGLKLRARKRWELKIRSEVRENGVEIWRKTRVKGNPSTDDELCNALTDMGFSDVATILQNKGIHRLAVDKRRIQADFQGTCLEQTDCYAKVGDESKIIRTICIEGDEHDVGNVKKSLEKTLAEKEVDFRIEGYPSWVCRLLGLEH